MLLPIIYYGNPLLRKKAEPVGKITPEVLDLIRNMEETMDSKMGLGIAAPQIGSSLAIFLIRPPIDVNGQFEREPTRVFINPKLYDPSEESWIHEEACLSIPKVYGEVERPAEVTVTALDERGKEFTEHFSGWAARVIMHENDHLNGVLFIDRLSAKRRREIEQRLNQIKRGHI